MAKRKSSEGNWAERYVLMVWADSYHALHVLNIKSPVRMKIGHREWAVTGLPTMVVPFEALEKKARTFKPDFFDRGEYNSMDLVGVLVADWSPMGRGQIVWAIPSEKKGKEEGADRMTAAAQADEPTEGEVA